MALTATILRSASAVVPLAARLVGGQRYTHHCRTFLSAVNHSRNILPKNASSFPLVCRYSSSASAVVKRSTSDESLLRVIEAEIECAEESVEEVEGVPKGFPFKLEDNPGQQTVSLSREYQGETITVEVEIPDLLDEDEEGENEDEDNDDDAEQSDQTSVSMVVKVSKPGAPSLEFGVTGYTDDVLIESLSVKDPGMTDDQLPYEGPRFDELDENLQKAFHKYLEIRGIKPSVMGFLHDYMVNKEHREYTNWLKNLKKFVEA